MSWSFGSSSSKEDLVARSALTEHTVYVNCFFGGTASRFADKTTQIEMLGELCDALLLRDERPEKNDWANADEHVKFCFDGCGQTNGTMGMLFAVGLEEQVKKVVVFCRDVVVQHRRRLVVNGCGLSRGGMACLLLARRLQEAFANDEDQAAVVVNLLVFDPVPGNLITSSTLDLFGATFAKQNMDLSHVSIIDRVLGLYPVEPLPDYAFHAPILPTYHANTKVEEDVILGCHQGAIWSYSVRGHLERELSFVMMVEFLVSCGVVFLEDVVSFVPEDHVLQRLDRLCKADDRPEIVRHAHTYRGVRIRQRAGGQWLNRWHARKRGAQPEELILSISE